MKSAIHRVTTASLLVLGAFLCWSQPTRAASPADCEAYAKRVEADSRSVAGSAGRGALGGAAFGVIVGDSSKAAGRGAVIGGIVGGVSRGVKKNEAYKRAYDDCMAGRVKF